MKYFLPREEEEDVMDIDLDDYVGDDLEIEPDPLAPYDEDLY